MSKNHLRIRLPLQRLNHLMTPNPIIMIPRQPPLRLIRPEILSHMILIRRTEPSPRIGHVDLHHTESGGVAWGMDHVDPCRELEVGAGERLPVLFEGEVFGEVDT